MSNTGVIASQRVGLTSVERITAVDYPETVQST
jgi:hypothetical protein